MKYMGSKKKLSKKLLPLILENRKENQWYIEPFVGGFNLIENVNGNRWGNDNHLYLIELFKAIQQGWEPPDYVSEEEYKEVRANSLKYPNYLVGFIGFASSYGGKWWGGYARGKTTKGESRNYTLETKNHLMKQKHKINDVKITYGCYSELCLPDNCIIYCDPPYQGTTKYHQSFDYNHFFNWCRNMKEQGHTIYLSEYSAPDDFKCIFSAEQKSNLILRNTKQSTEKLFTL